MEIIQQIMCLILWLLIIPFFVGIIPTYLIEPKNKKITTIYLCGWLLSIAIFQVIGSAFVLTSRSLTDLVFVYSFVIFFISVSGALIVVLGMVRNTTVEYFHIPNFKSLKLRDWLTWGVFAILLGFQLLHSFLMATPNGDDSYYLSISVMADKLDALFNLSPYTGYTEEFHFRHALSQFPIFYAFLARVSGIHATVIAHRYMAPALIGLTYLIFYKIGDALFENDKEKVPVFMVLISGIQLFGASSIYSNEVFLLTRTWQGKSLLANIAIPAMFLILLRISKCSERNNESLDNGFFGYYVLLALTNIIGGFASGLGLLLLALFEGLVLVIIAIRNRRSMVIIAGLFSLLPNMIYMLLYVLL